MLALPYLDSKYNSVYTLQQIEKNGWKYSNRIFKELKFEYIKLNDKSLSKIYILKMYAVSYEPSYNSYLKYFTYFKFTLKIAVLKASVL